MAANPNEPLFRWFFTSPDSIYEAGDILRTTGANREVVNAWIKRGVLEPDGVSADGRRHTYGPLKLADIKVAAGLVRLGVGPTQAFAAARVVNVMSLSWFAGREWKDGDPMPSFKKDFRSQFATVHFSIGDPLFVVCDIVDRADLGKLLHTGGLPQIAIPIGREWVHVAAYAKSRKDDDPMIATLRAKVKIQRRQV